MNEVSVNKPNSIGNSFLINEWNYSKNKDLNPFDLTKGMHKKVWWLCEKGHEWEAAIYSKKEKGCPYCSGRFPTKEKTVGFTHPHIASQWVFSKNGKLTPDNTSTSSGRKIWWKCPDCDSEYEAVVANRTRQGTGCTYCAGYKVNHTNSLATKNIDLASEWHPTKNGDLTPHDVPANKKGKVWWLGKCGHEWESAVYSRNTGIGCPVCANKIILKGFNDMWTTNPELASQLLNPEDGFKYTQLSGQKVDWKCLDCGYENKNKSISDISKTTNACPLCADGRSYPEKFMNNILKLCDIEFDYQKSFSWSMGKKYDFYIPSLNLIIETHGRQHYEEYNFKSNTYRTLIEEQENDRIKENIASDYGVKNYIVIDCRRSEPFYIKKSITNSLLTSFLSLEKIDWKVVIRNSNKSILPNIADYYNKNKNTLSYQEMRLFFGISMGTLKNYLKQGSEIGLCDYSPHGKNQAKKTTKRTSKSIVQLDLDNTFIKEWDSATDVIKGLNKKSVSCIVDACKGYQHTAYGFKWIYKDDYEKLNKAI